MAEDRDGRVEAAARAAIKELQRQGADYSPYVDLRDEADPRGFMIDGEIDLVDLAKVIIAAADAVSGAEKRDGPPFYPVEGKPGPWDRITPYEKDNTVEQRIDEIVMRECDVHLEMMNERAAFMSIGHRVFWINAFKGKLFVSYGEDRHPDGERPIVDHSLPPPPERGDG